MKKVTTTEQVKSTAIEVKALVQFELPVTIKENRIPLTVITDQHGNPWWVANEVCKVLGLTHVTNELSSLDHDEKMECTISTFQSPGRAGDSGKRIVINEPGLYRLISGSRKPVAKTFQRWVFHEVLPEIRKTGSYNTNPDQVPLVSLENIKQLHGALGYTLKELDRKEAVITKLEDQTKKMTPKAKFFDAVSNAYGNVNLTVAAKILGRGPHKLMALLRDIGILYYSRGGQNIPAQRHVDAGHFEVRTFVDRRGMVTP